MAESAAAVCGTSTVSQPSSSAIFDIVRPPAPPPAITIDSRGSMPWLIVISRTAPTMCSFATARIAQAARCTLKPSGRATARSTALCAAAASSSSLPPRK